MQFVGEILYMEAAIDEATARAHCLGWLGTAGPEDRPSTNQERGLDGRFLGDFEFVPAASDAVLALNGAQRAQRTQGIPYLGIRKPLYYVSHRTTLDANCQRCRIP